MTHVIVSGEKGGSVMYGEDDERGKSTVWQGDGARRLAVLPSFSGKLQNVHTYIHTYMCTHITVIHITHPCFPVVSQQTTSKDFSSGFQ